MIGYHYTSWRNWQSIKKDGLRPVAVTKDELLSYFDAFPIAVWVWQNPLEPESELGSIIYQLSTKASLKIVKLQIEYELEDCLYYNGPYGSRLVHLPHSGTMEKWEYHKSNPEAILVTKLIPPKNIKLLKIYDLLDIVK